MQETLTKIAQKLDLSFYTKPQLGSDNAHHWISHPANSLGWCLPVEANR